MDVLLHTVFNHLFHLLLNYLLNFLLQSIIIAPIFIHIFFQAIISHLLQRIFPLSEQLILYTPQALVLIIVHTFILEWSIFGLHKQGFECRFGGKSSIGVCNVILLEVGRSLCERNVDQRVMAVFLGRVFGHQRYFIVIIISTYQMATARLLVKIIIFLSLLIAIINAHPDSYFSTPLNLYISDQNYTSIFTKVVAKEHNMIGILFTNKFCRDCYASEPQLQLLISKIWKEQKIKIYRCEISANEEMQEYFGIKRFPSIQFVLPYEGSYVPYQSYDIVSYETIKTTINRLQYALKRQDFGKGLKENGIYVDEQKLFFFQQRQAIQYYTLNPVYHNLPHIIYSSHKQLKNTVMKDGVSQGELANCFIYAKNNKKCFSPSTAEQIAFIFSIVNFQKVIQFTQATYKAYQQLNLDRYIFIAVVDSVFDRDGSQAHLSMLNGLLKRREFHSKITIFWMETQINKQKLKHLGFKQTDRPPLFCLFDLTGAPKKILTNKKGKPAFNQPDIISFIKSIIKYDEDHEIVKWNEELMQESLQRLHLEKEYKLLSLKKQQFNQQQYFVLSFPTIEYELLGQAHIFYKMILNYRYLIKRINRFIDHNLEVNYLTFHPFKCHDTIEHGLFYIKKNKCHQITQKIIFDNQEISSTIMQFFYLPELFWVNEDHLQEYLTENYRQKQADDYQYFYI